MDRPADSHYDAIVVGAGIVGSYLARRLAESGLHPLLLDKRPADELGSWKNTGHNLDRRVFLDLPLNPPSAEETLASYDKALFRPPAGEPFEFRLPMVNVKLREFTARVNREAVDADVDFRAATPVTGLVVEEGVLKGVRCGSKEDEVAFRAPVTVDVSGIDAVVRGKLPPEFGFPRQLDRKDFLYVYGEDWKIGEEHKPGFTYHPKWQGWSGPRQPGVLGLGLGRFAARDEDPRDMFPDFAKDAWPAGGEVVYRAFNRVPLRHPFHSLVANGVMLLGDSACMGKPLNGEGVTVMLYAAELAREVIARAVNSGDVSASGLWDYNRVFMRDFGARFAVFHRLRYELLRMSRKELDFLFGLRMYGPEDMEGIMGRVEMPMNAGRLFRAVKAAARGIGRPDVLIRLVRANIEGNRLKELYRAYPDRPDSLPEWAEKVDELYQRD